MPPIVRQRASPVTAPMPKSAAPLLHVAGPVVGPEVPQARVAPHLTGSTCPTPFRGSHLSSTCGNAAKRFMG